MLNDGIPRWGEKGTSFADPISVTDNQYDLLLLFPQISTHALHPRNCWSMRYGVDVKGPWGGNDDSFTKRTTHTQKELCSKRKFRWLGRFAPGWFRVRARCKWLHLKLCVSLIHQDQFCDTNLLWWKPKSIDQVSSVDYPMRFKCLQLWLGWFLERDAHMHSHMFTLVGEIWVNL